MNLIFFFPWLNPCVLWISGVDPEYFWSPCVSWKMYFLWLKNKPRSGVKAGVSYTRENRCSLQLTPSTLIPGLSHLPSPLRKFNPLPCIVIIIFRSWTPVRVWHSHKTDVTRISCRLCFNGTSSFPTATMTSSLHSHLQHSGLGSTRKRSRLWHAFLLRLS